MVHDEFIVPAECYFLFIEVSVRVYERIYGEIKGEQTIVIGGIFIFI
jgi:hypothetical protein